MRAAQAIATRRRAFSDDLVRLMGNDFLPLRALRSFGFAALDRIAPLKRRFALRGMGFRGEAPATGVDADETPRRTRRDHRRCRRDRRGAGAGTCAQRISIAIVEARPPKPWSASDEVDPRVVALAADATRLLDDLGVWPEILAARACAYRRMHVWDALAPGELVFDAAERGEAALGYIVENTLDPACVVECARRYGATWQ